MNKNVYAWCAKNKQNKTDNVNMRVFKNGVTMTKATIPPSELQV